MKSNTKRFTLIQFLSPTVLRFLLLSITTGLVLLGIELLLSYFFRIFLAALGVTQETFPSIYAYFPENFSNLEKTLVALLVIRTLSVLQPFLFKPLHHKRVKNTLSVTLRIRLFNGPFLFGGKGFPTIISYVKEKTELSSDAILHFQVALLHGPVAFGCWVALLIAFPVGTLIATVVLVFIGILLKRYDHKISLIGKSCQTAFESINELTLSALRNLLFIRIYGLEKKECQLIQDKQNGVLNLNIRFSLLSGIKYAFPSFFGLFLVCSIILAAFNTQALTGSAILAYFYLFIRFTNSTAELARTTGAIFFLKPVVTEFL